MGVSRSAAISSSFTWLISIEERRSRSRPGTAPASRMSRASVKPASRSRKQPRLIPVRTTSRWPCRTRFSISASTAGARRLRERAAYERDHAEGATEAAAVLHLDERADAIEARVGLDAADRADVARHRVRDLLAPRWRRRRRSAGRPCESRRPRGSPSSRSRRRARGCAPPGRRPGGTSTTASCVTQHVFTTATSAPSARSSWPSAIRRSRNAWASEWETLQPRKRTENVAIPGRESTRARTDRPPTRRRFGARGARTARARASACGSTRPSRACATSTAAPSACTEARSMFAKPTSALGSRAAEAVAEQHVDLDAVRRRRFSALPRRRPRRGRSR